MKNRITEVIDKALKAQSASHLCMMMGSAFAANQAVFIKMQNEGYSDGTAAISAAIVAAVVASFVDGTLKGWLPFTIAGVIRKKDRKTGVERYAWFNWVIRILTLILIGVTTYLNVGLTPDIVDSAVGEADTSQYDTRMARAYDRYDRDLSIYEKNQATAQAELSKLKRRKKDDTKELIASKANAEVARLWASGNGWVMTPDCSGCKKAIQGAKRQVDEKIAEAEQKLSVAQAELSKFMSAAGASTDSIVVAANTGISFLENKNNSTKKTWTGITMVIMIISTVVFIGSTAVIVAYEEETGEDTSYRPTFQNILKNMFVKIKSGATTLVVKGFRLNNISHVPALAGTQVVTDYPTPEHRSPKNRKSEQSQKKSQESEKRSEKNRCKTEKCSTGVKSQSGETQKMPERTVPVSSDIARTEYAPGRVEEWPAPDEPGWDNFRKSARGWWDYANETDSATTKATNLEKWERVKEHCAAVGYIATVEENKKGKLRPVIRKAAFGEPIVLVEDQEYEWTNGSI